ncbi:MAG: TldD/PmbA family protein [Candidatus Sumerlaeota bacterium]|nr:TldD/PmbA family protein [Candidatus Sumerlaeota bacterium]
MLNEMQALEICEKALKKATADAALITVKGMDAATTRFADNVITQNVRKSDAAISVWCAYGQSQGEAETNKLTDDALAQVVQRAQAAARVAPPDPEYMPPIAADENAKFKKVQGWFDATAACDPLARAEAIRDAAQPIQSQGYRLSGAFSSEAGFHAIANSAGLRAYYRGTSAEIHTTVLGAEGTGWAQKTSSNLADIDAREVAAEAFEIARLAQKPQDVAPGRYPVILRPAAVWEMIPWQMICDAKATDEGRTFLRDKLGQKICGENITIRSDAADANCPARPFQNDGMSAPTLAWVERGVLNHLSTSRFWAKKQGREATGRPTNVIFDGSKKTVEEMIATMERGILVTRFWYIRVVDPMRSLLTGMTRDGLFWIENGRIARPLTQMRFNESVLECLNRVEELGRCERVENTWCPALKIRDFNFTSGTKF